MRRFILAAVAVLLCTPPTGADAVPRARSKRVPLSEYRAWSRVARCESGGFRVLGSYYPDPFGIDFTNWIGAGGRPMSVGWLSYAQRVYAITVARRFIHEYGIGIPDQHGCAAW